MLLTQSIRSMRTPGLKLKLTDSYLTWPSNLTLEKVRNSFQEPCFCTHSECTDHSQLICHLTSSCPLLLLLKQVSFSQSLTTITTYPPELLTHISSAYLTNPPPLSPPEKFWRVFIPLAERTQDVDQLVFGPGGEGGAGGGPLDEIVVEILIRGRGVEVATTGLHPSRRKGIERALEGWCESQGGACSLAELESLSSIIKQKIAFEQVRAHRKTTVKRATV